MTASLKRQLSVTKSADNFSITGASGLLGNALREHLNKFYNNIDAPSKSDLNFLVSDSTIKYFSKFEYYEASGSHTSLNCVYHLAAYVGGVKANSERLATFYSHNAQMGINFLDACSHSSVPKVVSVISPCVYPDTLYVSRSLTEDQLRIGPPHHSNFGYAYAKRMLDVLREWRV